MARSFTLRRADEDVLDATLRWAAASMTLAAGLVHLAQVGVHADEDWTFGAFFVAVGLLQVVGATYVAFPLASMRLTRALFRFGIVGSLATVAIWALSRTLGLPFGAEPGEPETVGLADAAADVFELLTAWLLFVWLRRTSGRRDLALVGAAGAAALVLAAVWLATRRLGLFDPDPRLVALPELTDFAAVAFLALAATLLFGLAVAPDAATQRAPLATVVAALLVAELSLTAFTLPARGGQNRDCRYGPIAEASGLRHSEPLDPVELELGEAKRAVVLLLTACAREPVELRAVVPANVAGGGVLIEGFAIDRSRESRARREGPPGGGTPVAGTSLRPGEGRYPVVVDVRADREGVYLIHALRVDYLFRGEPGSITFASFTSFCVGESCPHGR